MATQNLLLTLDNKVFIDLKKKAKKMHYESVQQYVYEIIRRNVYPTKKSGKSNARDSALMDKFSTSTPESRKIEKWAGKYGI